MKWIYHVLFFIFSSYSSIARSSNITARTKRFLDNQYLIFPEGSNVQLVYCLTIGTLMKQAGMFTMGVTAGVAYELPSERIVPIYRRSELYHRRSRRELYRQLETMFKGQGQDGRSCVLKALCKAGKRNRRGGGVEKGSFLDEIQRAIFTFPEPLSEQDADEARANLHYDHAYNAEDDCDELFAPDTNAETAADSCPFR